ncbi:hypothetical protein CDAR_104901 [Caerostris darwini]|uniref:Uncharacterized protein n=1 Tax=Caerostris darwini TaxID=1538125 RepID=A0AAV4V6E1_9ARAC|nr:hypothetical protein CDAR_104901 [Caerostris darwini]
MYLRTVNVKLLCIIWHLLVVVTSTYDTLDSTNEKPSTTSLKNLIISSPQDTTIEENDEGEKSSCREISLHRCGSSMVRVFRLLDFLPWKKSFEAKCALEKRLFYMYEI